MIAIQNWVKTIEKLGTIQKDLLVFFMVKTDYLLCKGRLTTLAPITREISTGVNFTRLLTCTVFFLHQKGLSREDKRRKTSSN